MIGPPGMPAERVKTLRDAFDAMVKDPEFIADIQKTNVELEPWPGDKLQDYVAGTLNVPPSVRERAKNAFGR